MLYRSLFGRTVLTGAVVFAVVCLVETFAGWPVIFLSLVGTALVQGALVETVANEREHRPQGSIAALYRSASTRIGALVRVSLLTGIGVASACSCSSSRGSCSSRAGRSQSPR